MMIKYKYLTLIVKKEEDSKIFYKMNKAKG